MTPRKGATARRSSLPEGALPRGLRREEAAAYIGVSPSTFDTMVKGGTMPKPKTIGARRVWDKWKLDAAFNELPGDEVCGDDVWDQVS
jgi:predicted DNA-binding transcriptional regulator AlpA